MYNLLMDTSTDYLFIALVDKDLKGDVYVEKHHKKTSEFIIFTLASMMKKQQLTIDDIESIIVTKGPGSFTGIRLALTVAKIIGFAKKKKVYAISSLQAYCHPLKPTLVILDARANRYYVGHYQDNQAIQDDCIMTIDAFNSYKNLHASAHVVSIESIFSNPVQLIKTMMLGKQPSSLVNSIHTLSPVYLKPL